MKVILVFAAAMTCSGCALTTPKPVVKRWANEVVLPRWEAPGLELAATGIDPPGSTRLKDLPGESGAAYVTALSSKLSDSDAFRSAVSAALSVDKGPADRTVLSYTRALLISVNRPATRPGDRLLSTKVEIIPRNFEFTDFVGAETAYATVSIEKVSVTRGSEVNAKLSPTLKADIVGTGEIGGKLSASRQEGYDVTERYDGLSVVPSARKLSVMREGALGIDLTGNTVIKLVVKPNELSADGNDKSTYYMIVRSMSLVTGGKDLPSDQAKLAVFLEKFPAAEPLWACASLKYEDRAIQAGAEFYDESRHTVNLVQGVTAGIPVIVVTADELAPPLWTISVENLPIRMATSRGAQEMAFTDPTSASAFLNWAIRQKAANIQSNALTTSLGGAIDWTKASVRPLRTRAPAAQTASLSC